MVDTDVLDQRVSAAIWGRLMETGAMPSAGEVAPQLGVSAQETIAAFGRLAAARLLVLEPSDRGSIRMANPFSAVPTPFVVACAGREWWGNCIWDSLGIAAALDSDAVITCDCGDCGDPMRVEVRDGQVMGDGLIHIGVPARNWWDNIIYT